ALHFYTQALKHCGYPLTPRPHVAVAAVGQATAHAVRENVVFSNCPVICPPAEQPQDSESLWRLLEPQIKQFARVLIIRAQTGRDWLSQQLNKVQGLQLTRQAVYRRQPRVWLEDEAQHLKAALLTT